MSQLDRLAAMPEAFGIKGVASTATGIRFDHTVSFDEWADVGRVLGAASSWASFALGDWLVHGETTWPDTYAQAIEYTRKPKATLLELARVARKVPPTRRRERLSWSHHQAVAARTPEEQTEWLDAAEANGWSLEELRGMLAAPRRLGEKPHQRFPARAAQTERIVDVAKTIVATCMPEKDGTVHVPGDLFERLARAVYAEDEA